MNDKLLRQTVIDQLDWDPSIDSANIGVAVDDGVVTLSGHVPTYLQLLTAEKAVRGVKGVRGIAQEMEVRLGEAFPMNDEDVAKRAVTALESDVMVPMEAVQVKVSRGWVTLTGQVEWDFQRRAAEADINKLRGVIGLINNIMIKSRPAAPDIANRIKDALTRDASIDAHAIKVKVDGDKVTLDGSVDCWRDRDLVEHAAWGAPGVRQVVDHLHIA